MRNRSLLGVIQGILETLMTSTCEVNLWVVGRREGVDPRHPPFFPFSSVSSLMPRKLQPFPLHVAGSNLCHNLYFIGVHSLFFLSVMTSLMSGPGRLRLLRREMYEETGSNYIFSILFIASPSIFLQTFMISCPFRTT